MNLHYLVEILYIISFSLFIYGLMGLTGPKTAVRGNLIAAAGMTIAVAATLVMIRHTSQWPLIIAGLVVGVVLGVPPARLTKMTAMPQLVAFFNGVGGGTVALIALSEFIDTTGFSAFQHGESPTVHIVVASLFAAIIGSISFWGSIVAFGKLQENRSIPAIVAGGFGGGGVAPSGGGDDKHVKATSAADAAIQMAYANQVIVVPGYGLAVAQAQHAVKDLATLLEDRGVPVKYAIHPVAGRMPGHMNVLLAEAEVDYDAMKDMDDINDEFARTDVTIVIGANDVTNPAARNETSSPIYGMPILNVDKSRSVIVLKRSMNSGFAGIDNPLFYADGTTMLFGDAKKSVTEVSEELKAL